MSVFLDSSALIAYYRDSDENHATARHILNELDEKNASMSISSHILEEVVTFLASRDGPNKAFDVGQRLLLLQNLEVIWVQRKNVEAAMGILRKSRGLSLCDALTVVLMQEQGIEQLASFDSDFDQFKHIQRIH